MRATFRVVAALFVCAAAYHVFAVVSGAPSERVRHATFALINLFVAVLMIRRPPGFAIAFALLCGQQLGSHGADLARAFAEGHVDWTSLFVVVAMPSALVLLLVDARRRRG
jgi:hypothetical protein